MSNNTLFCLYYQYVYNLMVIIREDGQRASDLVMSVIFKSWISSLSGDCCKVSGQYTMVFFYTYSGGGWKVVKTSMPSGYVGIFVSR